MKLAVELLSSENLNNHLLTLGGSRNKNYEFLEYNLFIAFQKPNAFVCMIHVFSPVVIST